MPQFTVYLQEGLLRIILPGSVDGNTVRKFYARRLRLFSWPLVVLTMTYISVLNGLLRIPEQLSSYEHAAYLAGSGSNFVELRIAE